MRGVARAHSLAWNLHKMVGATQQCAAFLVREPGLLGRVFGGGADYLFQPDKPHAGLDSGDLTYHCARRVDALKAWLLWKARGDAGLGLWAGDAGLIATTRTATTGFDLYAYVMAGHDSLGAGSPGTGLDPGPSSKRR